MKVGSITIGPNDYFEIKGKNEIWIWKQGKIEVLFSDSMLMSRLISEWQEKNKAQECYEDGAGI